LEETVVVDMMASYLTGKTHTGHAHGPSSDDDAIVVTRRSRLKAQRDVKRFGVRTIALFGSYAVDAQTDSSDVDFPVYEPNPEEWDNTYRGRRT
jgi:predicted nucleotidyltransferase